MVFMDLNTVAEFLNTIDERRFGPHRQKAAGVREELGSPRQLKQWLGERGLIEPRTPVRQADLDLLLQLRAQLRTHVGAPQTSAGQEDLNRLLAELPLRVRFDGDGPTLEAAERSAGARFAAEVVSAALTVAARGEWYRLKLCAADDCRWAFYDDSRNGLGRWCAMRVCGNRNKTKRYRAQNRATRRVGRAR
jgi:predicted RNA-binding Zn ribbon-like protein